MKFIQRLCAALFLLASTALAQYTLTPPAKMQFFAADGTPLAGGLLYTYQAGTTSLLATYQDSGGTPNTDPVVLDAGGYADIWLANNTGYKFCVADSNDVQLWCVDNIENHVINSYADIIALWSGTCNSGTFLRGDGQCITPVGAGNLFAAPPYLGQGRVPIASGTFDMNGSTFTQQLVDSPLIALPLSNSPLGAGLRYMSNVAGGGYASFLNLGTQSSAAITWTTASLSTVTGGLLYKLDAFSRAIPLTTADTTIPAFIAVGTPTGSLNGILAIGGIAFCTYDNVAVVNDYVVASTTVAGNCHDSGLQAPTDPPAGSFVIGTVVANGVYIWPRSNVGLKDPGSNGIVYRSSLNSTRPATFADAVAMWSSCGSPTTEALYADGVCRTPAGAGNVSTSGMTTGKLPKAVSSTALGDSVIQEVDTDGTNYSYVELNDAGAHPSGLIALRQISPQGTTSNRLLITSTGLAAGNLVKLVDGGGTGHWAKALTTDTDVLVLPVQLISSDIGGSAVWTVQMSGMANILDDGTPCTPGHTVVASSSTAATIHDTGGTTPGAGTFTVGVCLIGSTPDLVLLNPQFN